MLASCAVMRHHAVVLNASRKRRVTLSKVNRKPLQCRTALFEVILLGVRTNYTIALLDPSRRIDTPVR